MKVRLKNIGIQSRTVQKKHGSAKKAKPTP